MRARTKRIVGGALGVVLLATLGAFGYGAYHLLPIVAGLKSTFMCSGVFVAGRAPEAVLREELGGLGIRTKLARDPQIDRTTQSVTTRPVFGLFPRVAAYRDGMGCVLLPRSSTPADVAAVPYVEQPFPPGDPSEIPWPQGDLLPDEPLPPEVDAAQLDAAVEAAFTGERYDPHKTIAVVVVYEDRIIAERYASGWGPHVQYRTWSTAKSLTNALVGIAVREGLLALDQPAPIPEWQAPDDPRRAITIRNLLHMSSGLESEGFYTVNAYFGGIDTGKAIARKPLAYEPGTHWYYSNFDTLLLVRSIKEMLGDEERYLKFPRVELLNKLGMRDTIPETDPFGNYILSSQVYTTARDLARFGLLYLHDGVWGGERILPEGWVEFTRTPAPASLLLPEDDEDYGRYGAQFWIYGRDPRVPADTFSTDGARGQYSTIVPSRDLVVVRTGLDPIEDSGWDQEGFVADVLAAIGRPAA